MEISKTSKLGDEIIIGEIKERENMERIKEIQKRNVIQNTQENEISRNSSNLKELLQTKLGAEDPEKVARLIVNYGPNRSVDILYKKKNGKTNIFVFKLILIKIKIIFLL